MSDIFEEIDEELRQDQVFQWWKKHSKLIIAGLVVLVVGMGGYFGYKQWSDSKRQAGGNQLQTALEAKTAGETDAALATLSDLSSQGGSYGLLAQFERAKLLLEEGEREQALAAYEAIASDSTIEAEYRDLAVILSAFAQIGAASLSELERLLNPIMGVDRPYAASAKEIMILAQIDAGETAAARTSIEALQEEEEVPNGLQQRLTRYLADLPEAE